MNGLERWGAAKGLALAFSSGTLAACAVSTPVNVASVQQATSPVSSLTFVTPKDEDRGLRARFKTELSNALAARGVEVSANADLITDFTVSQRPAGLALQEVTSDNANASAPASDYRPRWFHQCKPDRVSASLMIYDKASGMLHSKAQGEFVACPGDLTQLGDLADMLAARALQN